MSDNEDVIPDGMKKLRSAVWDHFTVIDRKNYIASCNVCSRRLSYKTTVTNLRKHVERKHSEGVIYAEDVNIPSAAKRTPSYSSHSHSTSRWQREHRENKPYDVRKARLTELGGLEGLVLNVIGEDGETETFVAEQEAQEVFTEDVQYSATDDNHGEKSSKESTANKPQQTANVDPAERRRRSRLMDLQLECLEIKKYHMQLEALMLEQQLNIRRSIFTEPLRCPDTYTKGTQTDVGGENTKVFYIADSKGGAPKRHLFAMQDLE